MPGNSGLTLIQGHLIFSRALSIVYRACFLLLLLVLGWSGKAVYSVAALPASRAMFLSSSFSVSTQSTTQHLDQLYLANTFHSKGIKCQTSHLDPRHFCIRLVTHQTPFECFDASKILIWNFQAAFLAILCGRRASHYLVCLSRCRSLDKSAFSGLVSSYLETPDPGAELMR